MKNSFPKAAKIALIFVYLVIVAGAMVRMTGSGMGCPDWPKCFGYYIPPTDIKQLTWSENREFQKGQVIIKDETLLVAKDNFTTGPQFDASHWEKYTKHDYAQFNVYHTWVEYVNRLVGALAGLACFVMAVFSFSYWKKKRKIVGLSWLVVFMMGFQGWLGAKVVYSVLNPIKITIHMVVALLIVALILYTIRLASPKPVTKNYNPAFQRIVIVALLLTLIQIVLGTQVREHVDEQVKNGVTASIMWLQNPILEFYLHRSFSIIVLFVNLNLFVRNRKGIYGFKEMNWILTVIAIEIVTGISMAYFDFPFGSQAIHLVLASILFGLQFYMVLEGRSVKKALTS